MKLTVLIPTQVFLVATVQKINAEGKNGAFGLLPNHLDCIAALVPGILSYKDQQGTEIFIAVDQGLLVKCGQEVFVSTERAIKDADLETLHRTVAEQFQKLNEQQKITRTVLARLESGLARGILSMGDINHETTSS